MLSRMKLITNNKALVEQFGKFVLVGLLNTSIHYLVFFLLYKYAGIHYLAASFIGYSAGLVNSFFINKKWTFQYVQKSRWPEFIKFLLVNVAALFINIALLETFVTLFRIIPEISQIIAIGGSTVVNFLGNKFWTFAKRN